MSSLSQASHEHHDRLMPHVERLAIGDRIGAHATPEDRAGLRDLVCFLTGTLMPHMDAAEQTLYPELERILQNQHSMTPMRREHTHMRHLVDALVTQHGQIGSRPLTTREVIALRRSVFGLYALLKVHLAEEELYLGVVEHGVTPEVAGALAAAMEHPMVAPA